MIAMLDLTSCSCLALTFLIEGGHAQWKMVFLNTEYCEISVVVLFGVHHYGELQSRILGVDEHHGFWRDFALCTGRTNRSRSDRAAPFTPMAFWRWL